MRGIYIGLTTLLLALGACSGGGKTVEISNGGLTVGFERITGRGEWTSCGSAPFGTFEGPTTLTHTVPPRTSCLLELTD